MSEMVLQQLLTEAGSGGIDQESGVGRRPWVEAAADWGSLGSPENYLGYERTDNFASPGGSVWIRATSTPPPHGCGSIIGRLPGLDGGAGGRRCNAAGGRIALRFHARDLHLVMGPPAPETPVRFRVLIDGQPPGAAHGTDVDDQGNGTVTEPRLYQLIRQPGPIADRTFEIEFLDPGVQAYAFTFG